MPASTRNVKEATVTWNDAIRQAHRWLALVFTATVIANFVAMALGPPPAWIVYSPLLPLFLLMFSGLTMFALPYAAGWRIGRRAGG
jgi:hypothetical protein